MLLPEDLSPPPFTDDDLDAYFDWQEDATVGEGFGVDDPLDDPMPVAAKWEITGTDSAEWAMRRAAHTAARIEDISLQAAEFIRQITEWKRRELAPLERRAAFFEHHLTEWLRKHREDPGDGRASIALPSGDITSNKVPARPEVVKADEERFINWARAMELPIVKATWKPVMAEVKKVVEFLTLESGEVVALIGDRPVPGVVLVPETVNYHVKPRLP